MNRKRGFKSGRAGSGASSGQSVVDFRFAVTFGICCILLFALATWLPESLFEPLNRHTARMSAYCLGPFGIHPVLQGLTLSQNCFAVKVITECSVLYMGILFFSFVVACPISLGRKLMGLALGIPVLHAGNILRIAAVFAIGLRKQNLFEFVHVYLGQVLMVLFVLAVCMAWLRAASPAAPRFMPAAFLVRFVAFSAIPFLVWLAINKEYVRLTDHLVTALFALFDYRLEIPYQHEIYYQTFNVVTFIGLVLTSRHRVMQRKLTALAAGLAAIVGIQVMFRICNVLMTAFHNEPAIRLSMGISLVGQYLAPVLLWLLLLRGEPGAKGGRQAPE